MVNFSSKRIFSCINSFFRKFKKKKKALSEVALATIAIKSDRKLYEELKKNGCVKINGKIFTISRDKVKQK